MRSLRLNGDGLLSKIKDQFGKITEFGNMTFNSFKTLVRDCAPWEILKESFDRKNTDWSKDWALEGLEDFEKSLQQSFQTLHLISGHAYIQLCWEDK